MRVIEQRLLAAAGHRRGDSDVGPPRGRLTNADDGLRELAAGHLARVIPGREAVGHSRFAARPVDDAFSTDGLAVSPAPEIQPELLVDPPRERFERLESSGWVAVQLADVDLGSRIRRRAVVRVFVAGRTKGVALPDVRTHPSGAVRSRLRVQPGFAEPLARMLDIVPRVDDQRFTELHAVRRLARAPGPNLDQPPLPRAEKRRGLAAFLIALGGDRALGGVVPIDRRKGIGALEMLASRLRRMIPNAERGFEDAGLLIQDAGLLHMRSRHQFAIRPADPWDSQVILQREPAGRALREVQGNGEACDEFPRVELRPSDQRCGAGNAVGPGLARPIDLPAVPALVRAILLPGFVLDEDDARIVGRAGVGEQELRFLPRLLRRFIDAEESPPFREVILHVRPLHDARLQRRQDARRDGVRRILYGRQRSQHHPNIGGRDALLSQPGSPLVRGGVQQLIRQVPGAIPSIGGRAKHPPNLQLRGAARQGKGDIPVAILSRFGQELGRPLFRDIPLVIGRRPHRAADLHRHGVLRTGPGDAGEGQLGPPSRLLALLIRKRDRAGPHLASQLRPLRFGDIVGLLHQRVIAIRQQADGDLALDHVGVVGQDPAYIRIGWILGFPGRLPEFHPSCLLGDAAGGVLRDLFAGIEVELPCQPLAVGVRDRRAIRPCRILHDHAPVA